MSKLEQLVPALELCKQAAEKYSDAWNRDFGYTALHWLCCAGCRPAFVFPLDDICECGATAICPAPTLAEIIDVLDGPMFAPTAYRQAGSWHATVGVEPDFGLLDAQGKTAAEVALKLWMRVQEAGK